VRRSCAVAKLVNLDGIAGMVKAGAWLSNLLDLEVLGCGRAGDAPAQSCKLELSGQFLAYDITLDGGWIFLSVAVMDRGDPPESLLSLADNAENWRTICQLVAALERSAIRELQPRPLEIGPPGPNCWVIA
jgi:hypothetical protein